MKIKCLLLVVLFLVFFSNRTFAIEAPNPPLKFTAFVHNNTPNTGNSVYFKWIKDTRGTQPVLFILYVANDETQDLSKFKRSDYIQAGNLQEYQFVKNGLKPGKYSFFMTAAAIDGNSLIESRNSDIVTVEIVNNEKPYIKIISQPPTFAALGTVYNYYVKAITNLDANCPLVYSLREAPKGMTIDENKGVISWIPKENGVYKVSIMVGTTCKINIEPAIQEFTITVGHNNQGYVKILSQPPHTAFVGQPLVYQVLAQSNIRCPILFEFFSDNQDEISFDKKTGTLKWIPSKPGTYKFSIKAYLECDENITDIQTFVINVQDCNDDEICALITGFIEYDSENLPVKEGRINAWRIDKRTNINITFSAPIKDGYFTLKLPAGLYFLNFDGPDFITEWYKDAISIDKAEKIELKCDDEMKIRVSVERKKYPKTYIVSGNVSSEQGDKPLMATVQFIPIDWDRNNQNPNPPNSFITKTDAEGNYKIQLHDNFIYRAYAIPMDYNYYPQYYDKVESPFEADLIELTGDLSGIDFKLKLRYHHKNSFTGRVINDKDGNPIHSRVFAYLVGHIPNTHQRYSQMAETDRSGYFKFENLIPGQYVLLSIPYDRNYTPGYYKIGEVATLKWREATRISVGENMIDLVFEIRHKQRAGLKGIIRIDGVILDNSGRIRKSDSPSSLNTIAGAFVYILDEFGEVSDFAFTDVNGRFYLNEVPEGNNRLVVDYIGFQAYEQPLITDYSENLKNSGIIIVLESDEPLSNDYIFDSFINISTYPNPANNILNLQFSAREGLTKIYVYDIIGNLVLYSDIMTFEGINRTSLDIKTLNQGLYYLRVENGLRTQSMKFSIVR